MNHKLQKQRALQLSESGKLMEAKTVLEDLSSDYPQDGDIWIQLVNVYTGMGDLKGAEHSCRQLISLYPSAPEPYLQLSTTLLLQRKKEEATDILRKILELRPNDPDVLYKLGKALHLQSQFDEALSFYEKALAINSDMAEVLDSMGSIFMLRGQITRAIELYRKCMVVRPDFHLAHSDLLLAYNYSSDYDPDFVYREHLRWPEIHGLSDAPHGNHPNTRDPERRLRVGYISPDFLSHPVSHFMESLIKNHNRERIEVYCFSDARMIDNVTTYLKKLADNWHHTKSLTDKQLVKLINSHSIDILVDLTGHTASNRLRVFTDKPAPIQVSYLGYPNTTGLTQIDYRITDEQADPKGLTDQWHTEKLVRLPGGFLCYSPTSDPPPVSSLPFYKNKYITFGSFNNLAKITSQVIRVWSKILMAEPASRLIIKNFSLGDRHTREHFRRQFERLGIKPERVDPRPPVHATKEHLKAYGEIDIALDTFPYNGTTTSCEAIWMGVPVVTIKGKTHAECVGASILHRVELTHLIAENQNEYIETALKLARDPDQLASLRGALRGKMQGSPLCNAKRMTEELENAYREMWKKWCTRDRA